MVSGIEFPTSAGEVELNSPLPMNIAQTGAVVFGW